MLAEVDFPGPVQAARADVPGTDRLLAQPPGGMCQYKVRLTSPDEVDDELVAWARRAYDSAG